MLSGTIPRKPHPGPASEPYVLLDRLDALSHLAVTLTGCVEIARQMLLTVIALATSAAATILTRDVTR